MNSKILGNKLGLKHGTFKMDVELEKLKKENETLKKTLEEITKSKEILTDTERNRLLEETKKGASRDVLESQLKDALEKNQQWLVYDQQREAYVKGLMARIFELEQLGNSNQKILQLTTDAPVEAKQDEEQKKYYDRLLLKAKKDLEDERKFTAQLKSQLSDMQVEYEAQKTKMNALSEQLRSLQNSDIKQNDELKMCFKDKLQKLRNELELSKQNLEEEKSRTTELTNQVKVLNMSLLKQRKDQDRISALELQIQRCAADFENEKADRQNVQQQLHKVLKEVRKVQEQKRDVYNIAPLCNFHADFEEKLTIREQHPSPKHTSLLDESFLECPNCKKVYPTSQHRELLAHIDFCTS